MRKLFILLTMSLCFTWQLKAADYYWVGGSGNWSDFANHWATSSGGGTFHLQVPRTTDNLFFDANSFTAPGQIINIDTTIISCLNMDWTGVVNNPTLTSISSASLKIYGSLKLVPGMTFNSIPFTGVGFVFESTTPGKMITTGGKTLSQITFSGEGGGWTLQDGLAVAGDIRFNAGSLDMNSKPVSANTFTTGGSVGILPRTLTMGTMTFTGKWDIFNFTGNLTVSAASSTIITSGFRGAGFVYNDVLFPNGGSIFDGGNTFHNVSFGFTGSTIGNNTFNDLTFSRDGSISGNNTINNLTFLPGFTYSLGAGNTQTINSLTATGNCNQFITIKSNSPGIQAIISKASGTITLSYINLQDIKATGGATFIANNSIATGNNTGWTINGQAPRDLYWVGGSGNWNDGNHWSLSSGGSPLGCSPTFLDNVFFDVNSFPSSGQSVNISTPIVSCVNMDWTGVVNNPAFTSIPFASLKISGSLKLVPGMTINSIPFTGVGFEFTSTTTGKTITTGGKTLSQITFSGEGGGWTLQDGLTVDGSISFNAGSLDMNSKPVSANTFTTGGGAGILPRTLIMGTMTFTGRWDIFNFIGNLTVSAASSTIITNGFRGGGFVYNDVLFPNGGTIIDGGNTFDIVSFGFTGSTIGNNTFNDLTFSRDGSISGNNTINNLTFSPGFTYSLGAGNTQTINSLNATGNCNQFITIRSNGAGTQAILSKASGTVTLSYINLQDIKATGGATFIANNSIGTGNNTGWIINGQTPRDLYWVGGSGNWDDGNHWSLSSGGSPLGCSPTFLDNVFFDVNSFPSSGQSVNINTPIASCVNMDWTGVVNNPAFTSISFASLKISGSLKLVPGMTISSIPFSGIGFEFTSTTTGKTITTGGKMLSQITFSGEGGGWTLQDGLAVAGSISLNAGSLDMNSKPVSANTFTTGGVVSILPRTLTMGTMTFTGKWDIFNFTGDLTVSAASSTIITNAFRGGGFVYNDVLFPNGGTIIDGGNTFDIVSFGFNGSTTGNNIFNDLTFSREGNINGNNIINNLTFSPGFTYILNSGNTQTINRGFNTVGNGGFPILIRSSILGSFATISKDSGSVCTDFVRIRDIHAVGGASFNAGPNSEDLGGNAGWNFNAQTLQFFADADSDNYGVSSDFQFLCAPSGIYTATAGGDCNDNNAGIHPGATEICNNGIDENCDGQADENCCAGSVSIGADVNSYFGFLSEQCITKTAVVTNGTGPYAYQWTLGRPLLFDVINSSGDESLTGANTSTVTVCLLDTAVLYCTVTDSNGCIFIDSAIVYAEDVRCFSGNGNNQKVNICHHGSMICVEQHLVNGHLAHGDHVGYCPGQDLVQGEILNETNSKPAFNVFPNPATGKFYVSFFLPGLENKKGELQIINLGGQVIKRITVGNRSNIDIRLEQSGIYLIRLKIDKHEITRKIVVTQ